MEKQPIWKIVLSARTTDWQTGYEVSEREHARLCKAAHALSPTWLRILDLAGSGEEPGWSRNGVPIETERVPVYVENEFAAARVKALDSRRRNAMVAGIAGALNS